MFRTQTYTRLISTIVRFRFTLLVAICLVSIGALLLTTSRSSAAQNGCTPPGITVVNDATGDQTAGVTGATSAHDIQSVSISEQYPAGAGQLVVTMKVAGLSTSPPPNTNWRTFFIARHADGTSTKYFVTATTANPPAMTFKYGFVDTTATGTSNLTFGDADGGSFSPADGTLTVVLSFSKLKKPVAGTPNSTLDGPAVNLSAGTQLTEVNGVCTILVGSGLTGGSNVSMDTTGNGSYAMIGQSACSTQSNPSPTPTPSENSCFAPGVSVVTDATADQTGAPNANQQLDIQKVSIAEPFTVLTDHSITFTMKVANLNGTLQPNSTWQASFNAPDTSGASRTMFVTMNTTDLPGSVAFNYGYSADGFDTSQCSLGTCEVATGTYSTDGTITIKLNTGSTLSFSDVNGAHAFSANLSSAGISLSGIGAQTTLLIGAVGTGAIQTVDDTPSNGNYRTVSNAACQGGGGGTPTPTPTPSVSPTATPTPTPAVGTPQYANYYPPSGVAESWGEPSIGVNWNTGNVMFFGGINEYALRVRFDDNASPATVSWTQTPLFSNTVPRLAGDPILVTDRDTGRTFVSQLVGLTPSATLDITDNDGASYTPTQGFGLATGIDHQTIGVSPFHAPVPAGATYRNAVYYCAQEGLNSSGNGIANCAISLNGGLSFGPSVPVYIVNGYNSCAPLHGHLKGGPDGTVYLPNRKCGNGAGLVVSEDNGVTWTARTVPNSTVGDSDASVGVATDGTIFLGYEGSDGHPRIAVSHDKGVTWLHHTDVGAQLGIQNAVFPAVVAGDGGVDKARAAFAFYGSSSPGDQDDPAYRGEWYLYVASTFDGGRTWTTVNATPGDPMQRDGICTRGFQGCVVPRNLLDFFDATVDKEGRVLVAYQDGCMGPCVQSGPNSNTEKGVIARQASGKRMFAAYDPATTPTPTPTPSPSPTPTPSPSPTPTPSPSPTPTPGPTAPAATFNHNTMADFSALAGEPFIRIDKQDNVFVSGPFGFSTTVSLIWKSSDGGRTFIPIGSPIVRDGVVGPGGGDTHQDFDDKNRLYYSDLSAACVTVAVSEDGGNTFPAAQNSFLTCVGSPDEDEDRTGITDDRQWVAAFGDGIAYMTVRNLAVSSGGNFHMAKTSDAGRTWNIRIIGTVTQSGPLQVDKKKRKVTINGVEKDAIILYQLYYTGGTLKVLRVTDFNDGTPYIVDDLTVGTPGGSVSTVFPVLSVDKAGNVYVVWSNGSKISLATSTDRGNTWSAPKQVSPASLSGTNIMPWIVAGDPGRIDVVWYRTPGANNAQSVWDIHMAQSLDALNPSPGFTVNKVNENTIHTGEICLEGLNCDISTLAGEPRDRSFAEFPSIDIDSKGAAYITYNDSHNQLPAPYVMVSKQTGGASLFESVGMLSQPAGAVTIAQPAAGETVRTNSLTLNGTHSLSPKNFDKDESGDAKFPDHGAVIGSNVPAMDIKSVSLADNANSLTVTMQVGDLTTAALATASAQSGGDGVLYLTQLHSGDKIYWVGAEFRGGQARYLTGNLGTINSSTSKKYITYDPDLVNSLQVQGQVTNTAPGKITMTIPKSLIGSPANGTVFTTVTGYSLSERGVLLPMAAGQPNPSSMPIMVDASGATSYVVGQGGAQLDGVVEVSIDDPNFSSPRLAATGPDAVNDNGWTLELTGDQLVPGSHTLYVRQRINGRDPSAVVSRAFSVANTVEQQVTTLVNLLTANPRSSGGVSSFDASLKNISSDTIMSPVRIELASITSASGTVTAANADNSQTGVGASWDFSTRLGPDGVLSANEVSTARNLKFNNPRNEGFTVTFRVIGNLPRGSSGSNAMSGSSGSSGGEGSSSASTTTANATATISGAVFKVTFNSLLSTVSVALLKP